MKRFIQLLRCFIFYRTYRNIEKTITSMIDKSEGILENIKVDETVKFDKKWESHLFNIYDNPQEYPTSIKEKLDRYSYGQNWELAWVKATFELIGLSKIENNVEKLKDIIEETHIWYSIEAMKVLVKYPDFFDEVENIEFTERVFVKKGKFGSFGHVYMKYLSTLRDKPLVTSLLSRLITRSIVKDNYRAYLRSFYLIKDLYEQENPLIEKYCYYFLDVAISEQRIKEGKYSRRFKFTKPLKAHSLKMYLEIKPNDIFALDILEKWKTRETDKEILEILN
ncbi:hypothetical protein WAF17_06525 [Bernardetia sp. ABR2-2B]|uniref:hypothetical protein n=1 Tax=Bernardetia sp. ABR2-2B TaxID=3127472 RepID=UPI0030D443FD